MACSDCNNGCGGGISSVKLLSKEGLQHIVDVLSGKLFTVWGSLRVSASAPLHLEKTTGDGGETIITGSVDAATESSDGLMSSADKAKLDGLTTYDVATESSDGLMSSADKAKLDSLTDYDLATESSNGLMSRYDKATLDSLSSALSIHYLEASSLVFAAGSLTTSTIFEVLSGGVAVTVDSVTVSGGSPYAVTAVGDNDILVTATRGAATTTTGATVQVVCHVGSASVAAYIPIYALAASTTILQGYAVAADGELAGWFYTVDGREVSLQYDSAGRYWVNLPTSWQRLFGDLDMSSLFLHCTLGGKDAGRVIFCGPYAPGGIDNGSGDRATADCWCALRVTTYDGDGGNIDNAPFYISVDYVPSATYVSLPIDGAMYSSPVVAFSYGDETDMKSWSPLLSYSQPWTVGGVSQDPITTGATVAYSLVETYADTTLFSVAVDAATGVITVTWLEGATSMKQYGDVCRVACAVTLNGMTTTVMATAKCVMEAHQATFSDSDGDTLVYDAPVVACEYPPYNNSGECVPLVTYSQAWTKNGVAQDAITSGATLSFALADNYMPAYFAVTVDSATGAVVATRLAGNIYGGTLCRVTCMCTLNGVSSSVDADVSFGSISSDITKGTTTTEPGIVEGGGATGTTGETSYPLADGMLTLTCNASGLSSSALALSNVLVSVYSADNDGTGLSAVAAYRPASDPLVPVFDKGVLLSPSSSLLSLPSAGRLARVAISFTDDTCALNDKTISYVVRWYYGGGSRYEFTGRVYLQNKDMGDAGSWTTDDYDTVAAVIPYDSAYAMYPEVVLTISD